MGVEHEERLRFRLQVLEQQHQGGVLEHVGVVARVIAVAIIHDEKAGFPRVTKV
jgi:hypothetical protein